MKSDKKNKTLSAQATGAFISSLRKEKGLTQTQLAEELNVTNKAVSRWETGKGFPDVQTITELAVLFDISVDELLYGERIDTVQKEKQAKEIVTGAAVEKVNRKRRLKIMIIILCVFLSIFASFAALIVYQVIKVADLALESAVNDQLIIAEDDSYINVYGDRYVLFDTGDKYCKEGPDLGIGAVENADPFENLLSAKDVYIVKDCKNNELVRVGLGDNDSKFYCLDSCVEKYRYILNSPLDQCAARISDYVYDSYDVVLDEDITSLITDSSKLVKSTTVTCYLGNARESEIIFVDSKQSDGPFRKTIGELLFIDGEYYWFDYKDVPGGLEHYGSNDVYVYTLPDYLDKKLDILFERNQLI